jgi:hypothetical protein
LKLEPVLKIQTVEHGLESLLVRLRLPAVW